MLFLPGLSKILVAYTLLLLITSCTNRLPSEINENNTPKEILELGDEAYSKGYFEQAGDYYSEVNTYFPYSIEDELALSKAVDAYFKAGKFDETRIAASKFLSIYPESSKAQRVLYFRSKSFCDQIDIVERDQAAARDCITSFSAFEKLYPKSDLKKEAKRNISRASEFLVGQQLNVGKYYLKRNNPMAAMRRLKKIKSSTKDSTFLPEVSYRLIESLILVGLFPEAISENRYMKKKFPNSSWSRKASALIKKSGLD